MPFLLIKVVIKVMENTFFQTPLIIDDKLHIKKSFIVSPCNNGELIAESFGISGGYKNDIVDITIPTNQPVTYITGDSGSGKTVIGREISNSLGIPFTTDIPADILDKPLFQWFGVETDNQIEAIKEFCLFGLTDSVLWLNRFCNLSDSQKERAKLAYNFHFHNALVVDEFLSTLDRKTAQAVSFCIQKYVRANNKKIFCITAHKDLEEYLMPDVSIIGKAFPSEWAVHINNVKLANKIANETTLWYGTKDDYRKNRLGELHYKGKYTGGGKEYLFASYNNEIIGVVLGIYNMHTKGRRISRVVVHPSYRGCGIGVMMVKKYIADYPNTDVVASMALYNPIFEKAGMKRVSDTVVKPPGKLKKDLTSLNFNFSQWFNKEYLTEFLKSKANREVLAKYASKASLVIAPAGHRMNTQQMEEKVINEVFTAERVLFSFRPRTMAKYTT